MAAGRVLPRTPRPQTPPGAYPGKQGCLPVSAFECKRTSAFPLPSRPRPPHHGHPPFTHVTTPGYRRTHPSEPRALHTIPRKHALPGPTPPLDHRPPKNSPSTTTVLVAPPPSPPSATEPPHTRDPVPRRNPQVRTPLTRTREHPVACLPRHPASSGWGRLPPDSLPPGTAGGSSRAARPPWVGCRLPPSRGREPASVCQHGRRGLSTR